MVKALRKPLAFLLSFAIFMSAGVGLPAGIFSIAFAVEGDVRGDFIVSGGEYGVDYTYISGGYSSDGISILTDTPLTISTSALTDESIYIRSDANITLAGVNIHSYDSAIEIDENADYDVTITIADGTTNVLQSEYGAGIEKVSTPSGGTLTIQGGELGNGVLEAIGGTYIVEENNGVDYSSYGYGNAGIGSVYKENDSGNNGCETSNIVITGGTVIATGGDSYDSGGGGAGIGGGYEGRASNITITGGTVIATGGASNIGNGGAGIGGGGLADGSNITITGGVVTAKGGDLAAGIGGGAGYFDGCLGNGFNITIKGGSVKAIAGADAPNAIGGGSDWPAAIPSNGSENVYLAKIDNPDGDEILVDSEPYGYTEHNGETTVYAYLTGKSHTVKVGDEEYNYIFVQKAGVLANPDVQPDMDFEVTGGINGVDYAYSEPAKTLYVISSKAITIKNKADVGVADDVIEVCNGISADITLAGVNIDCSDTDGRAAFKIADDSSGNVKITLADGTSNTLRSGDGCAGLQKNGDITSGTLTIAGQALGTGSLFAESAYDAYYGGAGIGGGAEASGCNIKITGGEVRAIGGCRGEVSHSPYYGAGIGGGYYGYGKNITITGGKVDAGYIGSRFDGYYGYGETISLLGGAVEASFAEGTKVIISGASYNGSFPYVFAADGVTGVRCYELEVDGVSPVKVNGQTLNVKKHFDENKLYLWLPVNQVNKIETGGKVYYVEDGVKEEMKTLSASDFTFTAPVRNEYSGQAIEPVIVPRNDGIGEFVAYYYNSLGAPVSKPVDVGTYTVKLVVSEGDKYLAAGNLTDASWQFEITPKVIYNIATPAVEAKSGEVLSSIALPDGWVWDNSETVATSSVTSATAKLDASDKNYDYSNVYGYSSSLMSIVRDVEITVSKADVDIRCEVDEATAKEGDTVKVNYSAASKVTGEEISIGFEAFYQVENGSLVEFTDSFTIPQGSIAKKITIYVNSLSSSEYNSARYEYSFTVAGCTHQTSQPFTYQKDADNHYKVCPECDEIIEVSAHSGSVATCVQKSLCEICGYEVAPEDEDNHSFGGQYSYDDQNHWFECTFCGAKKDESAHTGGEADCQNKAVCQICHNGYGEPDEENGHGMTTAPTFTSGGQCSCGEIMTGFLGDVDSSGGEANLRDVVLLFQYIGGSDVTVDEKVADVYKDEIINIRDVVKLFQYHNDWDV